MEVRNLLADVPSQLPDELTEAIVSGREFRVERIVSRGHASPPGFWYDQDEDEWVALLAGAARLQFEDEAKPTEFRSGDFVNIPAHRRHRVEWTTPDEPTVWLAVFYRS